MTASRGVLARYIGIDYSGAQGRRRANDLATRSALALREQFVDLLTIIARAAAR